MIFSFVYLKISLEIWKGFWFAAETHSLKKILRYLAKVLGWIKIPAL